MSTAYYKAAHPTPPRCIGLQLRPYSLGHHIALRACDSSFLNGSGELFTDLILGVFICSQTWKEWQGWRNSWKLPLFLRIWGWKYRKFDVAKEGEAFAQYLKEGEEIPELQVPAKGQALSAPWEARIKLFLVQQLRVSVDEAMDYPLALAWEDYCAYGEREGFLTLLSESDKATLDFMASGRAQEMIREAKEAAAREKN